ncbi:uncharacterized protein LOC118820651 [Colossoma macropomum]|uniref:uncharacterized protein LOC118820651 n=1 Tax=Colossoma macropomum TaxID=42526 RepID=UPI001863F73F|nr:uncharacterized protein LOC118820651 [Colossoma macropomum]
MSSGETHKTCDALKTSEHDAPESENLLEKAPTVFLEYSDCLFLTIISTLRSMSNESLKRKQSAEDTDNKRECVLKIVTWNINRQKQIKIQDAVNRLSQSHPDVIFLQETCIGVGQKIELVGWTAFYTQYNNKEKGAAILVKNKQQLKFKLYNQEVDRNGRYVVVQCELLGRCYTLVCMYNHQKDTKTLDLLSPFLQTMTVGTLVIGGDFNTTFSLNDRAKIVPPSTDLLRYREEETGKKQKNPQHQKTKTIVARFTRSLQLADVFRRNKMEKSDGSIDQTWFTYRMNKKVTKTVNGKQTKSDETILSRLDYFFMPEEYMNSVVDCCVLEINDNDHSPLLLKLDSAPLREEKQVETQHEWEAKDQKRINAVEIVAAIQSLQLRDIVKRDDKLSSYKKLQAEEIDDLKWDYNQYLQLDETARQNKRNYKKLDPEKFKTADHDKHHYFFKVEYLILATILLWRLEDWGQKGKTNRKKTQSETPKHSLALRSKDCLLKTDIEWTQLKRCIEQKLQGHPFVTDFDILEEMLDRGTTPEKRMLRKGCPLTHILPKLHQKYNRQEYHLEEEFFTDEEESDSDEYDPSSYDESD